MPDVHEKELEKRKDAIEKELERFPVTEGDALPDIKLKIETYQLYADYLVKGRQANHPKVFIYGPLLTSAAGLLIALAVGTAGWWSSNNQYRKDQGELVLKVIEASDNANVANNLAAFRNAELITIPRDRLEALAENWKPLVRR
jgi:hypothetical protein